MASSTHIRRRIRQSTALRASVAWLASAYIKLVRLTGRFEVRRGDVPARFWADGEPFIIATWHGQNLILPNFWHNWREMRVLVSRHGDGDIIARIVNSFGLGVIRGSGVPRNLAEAHPRHKTKGGAAALRAMIRAIGDDISVGLTADLPPGPARLAGSGIIALARLSGAPIIPVAATTSARVVLNNWDRFVINLPFSKGAVVWGDPIHVPRDVDEAQAEALRQQLEEALNAVTLEADKMVGRRPNPPLKRTGQAPTRAG